LKQNEGIAQNLWSSELKRLLENSSNQNQVGWQYNRTLTKALKMQKYYEQTSVPNFSPSKAPIGFCSINFGRCLSHNLAPTPQ
jgi:hypothetical protein